MKEKEKDRLSKIDVNLKAPNSKKQKIKHSEAEGIENLPLKKLLAKGDQLLKK